MYKMNFVMIDEKGMDILKQIESTEKCSAYSIMDRTVNSVVFFQQLLYCT